MHREYYIDQTWTIFAYFSIFQKGLFYTCALKKNSTHIFWLSDVCQGRRRRGAGGGGARASPLSKVWGAQVGLCPPPPTFGQSKCSNFTICTYFVVKNTIFSKFSWLASLANFNKSIFYKLCLLKTLEYFFIYSSLIALQYIPIYIYQYIKCVPICICNFQIWSLSNYA